MRLHEPQDEDDLWWSLCDATVNRNLVATTTRVEAGERATTTGARTTTTTAELRPTLSNCKTATTARKCRVINHDRRMYVGEQAELASATTRQVAPDLTETVLLYFFTTFANLRHLI
jgi:hypothetical protein